jgi:hypothetical protein
MNRIFIFFFTTERELHRLSRIYFTYLTFRNVIMLFTEMFFEMLNATAEES